MKKNGARCLLMGGQACVFYGAAEFSRDIDLAILCEPGNLETLQRALDELQARCIAVPPFEKRYLLEAHDYQNKHHATDQMIRFWLQEIHDLELLAEIVQLFPSQAGPASARRPAIRSLLAGNRTRADKQLRGEIDREKAVDRAYWAPLKVELNRLRHDRGKTP